MVLECWLWHTCHFFPVQRRWSFVMIYGLYLAFADVFFCLLFYVKGNFLKTFKTESGMTVYDSLFLCACLLRVYNSVHAFLLYIQLSGSLFGIAKGWSHKKPIIFLVNEENICRLIYCCTIYNFSSCISYQVFHLQTKTDPYSTSTKWKCMYHARLCQTWIHACA